MFYKGGMVISDQIVQLIIIHRYSTIALCCYREYLEGPKVFKSKGLVSAGAGAGALLELV